MKILARATLRILGILAPAALVSCESTIQPPYGVPVRLGVSGKVIVRKSGVGVPGIRIDCLKADSPPYAAAYSKKDGVFEISGACDQLRAEDVDGAENGGPYQAATVDVEPFDENVLIKLEE